MERRTNAASGGRISITIFRRIRPPALDVSGGGRGAAAAVRGTLLWQEGLLQLFRYIEQNRAVCLCALKSVGREHLKRFFEADIHAIIHRAVEQIGARALKKRTWIS